jgi:hypothetical protein
MFRLEPVGPVLVPYCVCSLVCVHARERRIENESGILTCDFVASASLLAVTYQVATIAKFQTRL